MVSVMVVMVPVPARVLNALKMLFVMRTDGVFAIITGQVHHVWSMKVLVTNDAILAWDRRQMIVWYASKIAH